MYIRTIRITAKLFLSVFLLTCVLGSSSGAVRAPGDNPKTKDSGAKELSGNPGDKTLVEGQGNSEENRDSGTKDEEQSDKIEISSDQPTIGSFSIQIAAFNDEDNAGTYVARNRQLRRAPSRRPVRPIRCRKDETIVGESIWTTWSRSPTSMPSSSVLVATITQLPSSAKAFSAW